ncbi:MAG: hypothetical protein CMK09_05925 [Ponticaulis sp.]|nr:hypothetical protein [Ponticaulis sp.]|tara:strand:- start:41939 stop:42790 length:852 start_codon:yes stop_codon:yes gene_type:complete
MRNCLKFLLCCFLILAGIGAQAEMEFDEPDRMTDALVEKCLEQPGVDFIENTDVICYNAAIFPEQFLKLNTLADASRIIITSPGGNVATARGMSTILDNRGEPAVIAGPCMSACAMVILPGLDQVHIHHTAHIAVHGITMIPFGRWWGWLKDDAEPSRFNTMTAQLGYDLKFAMHSSGTSHMRDHLNGQGVDVAYIQDISDRMEADARAFSGCRVDVKDYWGIVTAEDIRKSLGDHVTRMEAFVQNWSDPANAEYRSWGKSISDLTYIMQNVWREEGCSRVSE